MSIRSKVKHLVHDIENQKRNKHARNQFFYICAGIFFFARHTREEYKYGHVEVIDKGIQVT